ncbi:MAG: hypothetical protein KIH01_04005 [Candidatus Freyarchaeota archaeon]|nr:hypothetical protein [Candidatus Jordarchaeia archaeon]
MELALLSETLPETPGGCGAASMVSLGSTCHIGSLTEWWFQQSAPFLDLRFPAMINYKRRFWYGKIDFFS